MGQMGELCQNVPPFPEHCQKLSLIGVNGNNSKVDWMSVLVMKHPVPCSRTRAMASLIQMYWRMNASIGTLAFELSGDPLG